MARHQKFINNLFSVSFRENRDHERSRSRLPTADVEYRRYDVDDRRSKEDFDDRRLKDDRHHEDQLRYSERLRKEFEIGRDRDSRHREREMRH